MNKYVQWGYVSRNNLGQKVVDKFMKLSKIGFLWNILQLIFCDFLSKNFKIWLLSSRLSTRHQIQAKFVRRLVRQLVHSLFGDNDLVPFHIWWKEIVLKREKVWKCFVQNCLKIFLLVFTSFKMDWNSENA